MSTLKGQGSPSLQASLTPLEQTAECLNCKERSGRPERVHKVDSHKVRQSIRMPGLRCDLRAGMSWTWQRQAQGLQC